MNRIKGKNKNRIWKTMSCVTAAALICGSMGAMAYGAGRESAAAGTAARPMETAFAEAAQNTLKASDETVYVITAADGSVQKIIASDWLSKAEGGYEYEMAETDGSLPISMKISYRLDGREITPAQAAGANGRLTIRFDFENLCPETVEINGKEESIYMPFAVLTGVVLDGSRVSDVEITNGRLLSDGERILAAGLALPGLKENLQMTAQGEENSLAQKINDLEIPQYIEITAQVTDFACESTYTIVTNELFAGDETEGLFDMDGLREETKALKEAMEKLIEGSDRLYDGLTTLSEKSDELSEGVNRLSEGGRQLSEGSGALREGAGSLYAGAEELLNGLTQLQGSSDALTGGARQVFDTLLSTAGSQLQAVGVETGTLTVENYGEVLNNILASIDGGAMHDQIFDQASATAREQVEQKVRANTETIRGQVTEGVRAAVLGQVLAGVTQQAGVTMSVEEYEQLSGLSEEELDQLAAAGELPAGVPALLQTVAAMTGEQLASEEVRAQIETVTEQKIQELIAANMQSSDVQNQIQAGVDGAKSGAADQIVALKSQLDSYNAFYQGISAYTAGVSQAAAGAAQLRDGAGQLSEGSASLDEGAAELSKGLQTLQAGGGALTDGVTQLKDGAKELSDGLRAFDEEGIRKLTRLLEEDLAELADRLQATLDVSGEYAPLAKGADAPEKSVRFLYKTEAIKE